ncbi:MAG: AAA family ATPase [Planctomycetota bacterium]
MNQAQGVADWVAASAGGARARVIACTGGKGGVGKTNLALALALGAASLGRRAVLLDGDLGLANVDILLNFEPRFTLSNVLAGEVSVRDALFEAPFGLRVLPGASGLPQLADLSRGQQAKLLAELEELEQDCELMIFDTGAGISRSVIDFCLASDEVLVVTTPEPTAIADAYALIKVVSQRNPNCRVWVVVNMAASRSEADLVHARLGDLARRFLAVEIQRAGFVLQDPEVPRAVRLHRPFSMHAPAGSAALCVREVARKLGFAEPCARRGAAGFMRRIGGLFG